MARTIKLAVSITYSYFLGLRNLSIITDCEREIFRKTGKKISIDNLPFEPEIFSEIFAKGNTDNVFQFESDGMKRVLTGFKPESFSDLILLVSLYRPGPARSIDTITNVKNGLEKPKYILPEMEEVLGSTYGKPVYQEQIQQIFNKFAGFSLGKADIIRRHMAKKHYDEFAAYKDEFVEGMIKRGASEKDVEAFWNELLDFAAYAFNKSHAAAYAYLAYVTAWLKYHYPAEYSVGCLNYPTDDGVENTLKSAMDSGIKVLCPDVNRSTEKFTVYGDAVLFGLGSVTQMTSAAKEVVAERNANGIYKNIVDFVLRTNVKKDAMVNLINSGAFDAFNDNRQYLLDWFEANQPVIKKVKEKTKKLAEETIPEKREKLKAAINDFIVELKAERDPVYYNVLEGLLREREAIGYFISSSPLDTIKEYPKEVITTIDKISDKKCKLFGFVSQYSVITTKRGEKMAKLTLVDNTGVQECTIFSRNMDKCKIKEFAFAIVSGKMFNDTFAVDSISEYKPSDYEVVVLNVNSMEEFEEKKKKFDTYSERYGAHVLVKLLKEDGSHIVIPVDESVRVSKDLELNW